MSGYEQKPFHFRYRFFGSLNCSGASTIGDHLHNATLHRIAGKLIDLNQDASSSTPTASVAQKTSASKSNCDADYNDGMLDGADNCPLMANPG